MSSQIDAVKNAIDIVALVGERVKLTRAGKNYKGLCPFHGEKSPSFFVTPELKAVVLKLMIM
jgi:DNA primase